MEKYGKITTREQRRRARRRKQRIKQIAVLAGLAIVLILLVVGCVKLIGAIGGEKEKEPEQQEVVQTETETEVAPPSETVRLEQMAEAEILWKSYAYDEAIALYQSIEGAAEDTEIQAKIAECEAEKASCVPVNMEEVTHIFYHSLVVDPHRAFANQETDSQAVGNNQWMTTVSEFNKITQEMYDRGYVMVSIHDLYEETVDDNGNTVWEPAEILLPPDKKAFVLSLDDLSYYHSYDNYGYAARLILDENGKVTNEYYDADGNLLIGAYDVVPLMDQFVEEHPDASYKGAKGIIALTGYNGVLGYRTDETYNLDDPDCDSHQRAWIEAHPDFTLENEREQAKKVADAMKENGWEFASHTWGHVRVGDRSLENLMVDNEKWVRNVVPIVGETDTIIFAHGQDLEGVGPYSSSNEKYQYFRNQGYDIFCNVDSNVYSTFYGEDYLRQGRRNLDGYRIYYNAIGNQDNLSDLFDAKEILDPDRPPVYEL